MTPRAISGDLAEKAGRLTRAVGRSFFGVTGPLAICVGLWMLAPWLGVVALGVLLLAVDRMVP